jgi:hypothetical protein
MESGSPATKPPRGKGVRVHLTSFGLQSYNKVPGATRAVSRHGAVLRLYKSEIPSLFGILLRDGGSILSRDDPKLFDEELETLLESYGPRIWPNIGEGDRQHHLDPQPGTTYDSEIVYPRDKSM